MVNSYTLARELCLSCTNHKKNVTPVRQQCSYVFLALTHRYDANFFQLICYTLQSKGHDRRKVSLGKHWHNFQQASGQPPAEQHWLPRIFQPNSFLNSPQFLCNHKPHLILDQLFMQDAAAQLSYLINDSMNGSASCIKNSLARTEQMQSMPRISAPAYVDSSNT